MTRDEAQAYDQLLAGIVVEAEQELERIEVDPSTRPVRVALRRLQIDAINARSSLAAED